MQSSIMFQVLTTVIGWVPHTDLKRRSHTTVKLLPKDRLPLHWAATWRTAAIVIFMVMELFVVMRNCNRENVENVAVDVGF